jgi:endonuclease/exonuclease/phosphatase (EEP) superfamily protein YafD
VRAALGTLFALLLAAIAVVGLLLHQIGTSSEYVIVAASFARVLMWAALPALLVAVLVRRWFIAIVAVALTVLMLVIQLPEFVAQTAPAHGTKVRVMQANLRVGKANPAAIVRLVREHHVQVLATEELTDDEEQRMIAAGLLKLLPYRFTRPLPNGGGGLGMWSRYPLHDAVDEPNFFLGVQHARIVLPDGAQMTFLAVHLAPPYPYGPQRWQAELPRLAAVLGRLPRKLPLVAAGDYNATVDHVQFRDQLLDRGYADAADQAGSGYGASYPTDRWFGPQIAIDHVLTRNAVATSLDTLDLPDSDHRGLLADVTLDPPRS